MGFWFSRFLLNQTGETLQTESIAFLEMLLPAGLNLEEPVFLKAEMLTVQKMA